MAAKEAKYLYEGNPSDIHQVNSFIKRNIGEMCYVSEISNDRDDMISIGIMRDEVIWNSDTDVPRLRFIRHDDVFRAYVEPATTGGFNLVTPSNKDIREAFKTSKKGFTERSEGMLLESIGSKILQVSQIHNQMNPIFEIVRCLLYEGELDRDDFKFWKPDKTRRYLGFLRELDIVSYEDARILPGKAMESQKMDSDVDLDKIYESILQRVVDKGMLMMFYALNMTHLHPFIKLTNLNCMMSIREDSALKWDWRKYQYYMEKVYGDRRNSQKLKIVSKAIDLSLAGIFDKEKNARSGETMYYCEKGIFDDYTVSCKNSSLY